VSLVHRATIHIQAHWLPVEGFLICGEKADGRPIDEVELAFALFAWDEDSYYGSLCTFEEWYGKQGVYLTALQAIHYFSQPSVANSNVSFDFDEEYTALQRAAPIIQRALEEGGFVPDFAAWQRGEHGWKLRLHCVEDEAALATLPDAAAWIHAAIQQHIESSVDVTSTRAALAAAHPMLHTPDAADLFTDEEEWLIAIGWLEDTTPFRVGLQLTEPVEVDGLWMLRVVLQDKLDPQRLLPYPEMGNDPYPSDWLPYLNKVLHRLARCGGLVPWLRDDVSPTQLRTHLDNSEAFTFLSDVSPILSESGYVLFVPAWWARVGKMSARLKAQVKSSVGSRNNPLFGLQQTIDFDWRYAIGDLDISEAAFEQLVAQKQRLVQFQGQWIQIDEAFYKQAQLLRDRVQKQHGLSLRDVLESHLLRVEMNAELAEGVADSVDNADGTSLLEIELNDHLQTMVRQLQHMDDVPLRQVPTSLCGQLRPYQQRGFSWLTWLRQFGFGACLADDMGLGKTIQFITYLLAIQEDSAAPSLLICPTSVLGNWQKEVARFAPSLRLYIHYGANRAHEATFQEAVADYDLVITTYTLAQLDQADLLQLHWHSICLDEAQNIKNAYTKQSQAIRGLTAGHRIAMTGTPMENRLTELWSIFDFINPGYLGSLRSFTEWFVNPIEKAQDNERITQVQRLVRPFLLRRMKTDPLIELDLPEKTEAKVYVSLTAEQAALYESVLQDMLTKLDTLLPMERRGAILATLTKLKQVCNHPALALKDGSTRRLVAERSAKVERLLEMVQELRAEGDQCLIFTQFVEAGNLLQSLLAEALGEPILFLHGGVPKAKRDAMITEFQSATSSPGVFLLSLKAGGVGLNLTAASHVFHFDRWWNPAVENQATDRAFRIGQTRHVQVHKFVALGTLEERIDEMIERKQTLSEHIVGAGEQWITEMSTDDLRDLFALRREWVTES
jgi:SNF2 family DNA or RNA helicase